jgi:hypothetical protein
MEKFTIENLKKMNDQQNSGLVHPYTCGGPSIKECKRLQSTIDRGEGNQVDYTPENEGVLIATEQGWVCPCGKYTQPFSPIQDAADFVLPGEEEVIANIERQAFFNSIENLADNFKSVHALEENGYKKAIDDVIEHLKKVW